MPAADTLRRDTLRGLKKLCGAWFLLCRNVFMRSGGGDDGKIDIQELEDLTVSLTHPATSNHLMHSSLVIIHPSP